MNISLPTAFIFLSTVKSQIPKASSRDRLERVRAKLSVVTLLLPKLHLRTGLITQESDTDDDSGNEAKNMDGSIINKVAAAQKLFATPERPNSPNMTRSSEGASVRFVDFQTPSPPIGRRSGVVSAPRRSVVMNTDENSNNLKNLIDPKRRLSSEPGLISSYQDSGDDSEHAQSRKASSSDLPRRLSRRLTPDERERSNSKPPLPPLEEETNPSSVIV